MQSYLTLGLLACCFFGVTGQALNAGRCPNPQSAGAFNVTQLTGNWYTIQRTEPLWSEYGASCVQVTFTINGGGRLEAAWSAKTWIVSSQREWTQDLEISKDDPSRLIGQGSSVKYMVVECDQVEYLVLYSCNQYIPNFLHGDEIRILARTRTMSRNTVMNIQRKLKSKGLRPKTLTYVNQVQCA